MTKSIWYTFLPHWILHSIRKYIYLIEIKEHKPINYGHTVQRTKINTTPKQSRQENNSTMHTHITNTSPRTHRSCQKLPWLGLDDRSKRDGPTGVRSDILEQEKRMECQWPAGQISMSSDQNYKNSGTSRMIITKQW